jgi:hypothetical protein
MVKIVIVKKNGDLECKKIKEFDINTLYKSCGFKKALGFTKVCTWKIPEKYFVSIFARDSGNSGQENKYELPPPVDTKLFYGKMAIVCTEEADIDSIKDYTIQEWEKDYETLFGGFEDLGSEDSSDSEDEDDIPDELKTKDGYMKDGFIVSSESDDESSSSEEYEDSNSELDEEEYDYSD